MTEEERAVVEWLIAESMFMVEVGQHHAQKLGQLQAILEWEDRNKQ